MTYTGTRPAKIAKAGAMQLVRGGALSPHDRPKGRGPGYPARGAVIHTQLGKYSDHYPFESSATCFVLTMFVYFIVLSYVSCSSLEGLVSGEFMKKCSIGNKWQHRPHKSPTQANSKNYYL